MTTHSKQTSRWAAGVAAMFLAGASALAQAGASGQGGLSPDTPTIAPEPSGASGSGALPKTPLPPRDASHAPQTGGSAAADGPKTPLPPRDTPRARQPAQKAAAKDPDWPCVQVKVGTLSYGQMWAGPPLDDAIKTWSADKDVAELVSELAARRTTMEDAKTEIEKFVNAAGDKADEKLTEAFAGVFDTINAERSQIVTGIERYARKQRALSEKIKDESIKMASRQQSMAEQNSREAQQRQQALDWDTRIYEERSQSLTYVCETPVILEQRAFDLGREIQARLTQKSQ